MATRPLPLQQAQDSLLVLEDLSGEVGLGVLGEELLGRDRVDVDLVVANEVERILGQFVLQIPPVLTAGLPIIAARFQLARRA